MAEAPACWRVETGSVEVWRTATGRPAQFLFSCGPGELILGAASGLTASGLFVRPAPDARLTPLDAAELAVLASTRDPGVAVWIGRLAELLREEFPPARPEPLVPGETRELTAGQLAEAPEARSASEGLSSSPRPCTRGRGVGGEGETAPLGQPPPSPPTPLPRVQGRGEEEGPARRASEGPPSAALNWLVCTAGRVRILNAIEVGPESPPFPLPPGIWLTATTAATCGLHAGPVGQPEALVEGLGLFAQLVLAILHAQDLRQVERQRERLRLRDEDDLRQTGEALGKLAGVLGAQPPPPAADALLAALAPIGQALGVTFRQPPGPWEGDPIDAVAEASLVRYRRVRLRDTWWRRDAGPMLGFLTPDASTGGSSAALRPVALLPAQGGYQLSDPEQPGTVPVTPAVSTRIAEEAVVFYRPLPPGSVGLMALLRWALVPFRRELGRILGLLLAVAVLALLTPVATRWIVDEFLPDGARRPLVEVCLALVAVGIGQALLLLAEGMVSVRVHTGMTLQVQAAVWDRLLRLGPSFYRQYAAGDLHQRAMLITEISRHVNGTVIRSLLSGVFSLLSLVLLIYYVPQLAWIGVGLAILGSAISVVLSLGIRRLALRMMLLRGQLMGFVVQLIQGISRLRVAAAERRAFNQWAGRFAEQLRLLGGIRLREDLNKLLTTLLSGLSMLLLLALAGNLLKPGAAGSGNPATTALALSPGRFVAFLAAYGMFTAGLTTVSQTIVDVVDVLARERLLRPLLQETPEHTGQRADPGPLRGQVALEQVSFRYQPGGPLVLSDVSLTARPGEFVAIVGPSGSGKSTLVRLLLGFEQAQGGRVLYDGRNLDSLDLLAVRRQLGVVLQSSWILAGTLYENIVAGHPIPPEEVWEAARAAALADDIEQMPMKLHTLVAAGGVNLSGGQRQRLLLARALVHRPRVLILDEATSALDNPTQARVSDNLRQRQITRIVIAHRLSTITQADRIYVLDQGRIVQTGTFAELAGREGLFRTLIQRQQG